MLKKTAGVLFGLTLLCGTCFGQTPLHGLVAGQSVRTDVERVAGQPVEVHSQTLVEYHPQEFDSKAWVNVAKMYVQYRVDSPIVERIEAIIERPISRSDAFKNIDLSTTAAHQPNLPEQPTARGKNGDRLVEYFGAPYYVVLTYQGADENSGVARSARYSKELFESAVSAIASPGASTSPSSAVSSAPAAAAGSSTTPSLGAQGPRSSPGPSPGAAAAATQPGDFIVRLLTPIDTRTSKKGDKVTAQVISPQQFSGDILEGSVKNSKSGNKVKGTAVLNFSFDTLNHAGQRIPVQASVKSVVNSQGKQGVDEEGQIVHKKNSLGTLAAGTGLGALVGGLAGGGKGAAIGAGVGAAAALVFVEVATQGPNVSFAPGSEFVVNLKRRS